MTKPQVRKHKTLMVPVDKLVISKVYQRDERELRIKKIVKEFDRDSLKSLLVAERDDGKLYVVDGQQRLAALKILGIPNAPCDIFQSTGVVHEAEVFRTVNHDRTSVTPQAVFKAELVAENPIALEIAGVVRKRGMKLELQSKSGGWPNLVCIATLRTVHRRGGKDHLGKVLDIVCGAWDGDIDACRGTLIDGVSTFIKKYSDQLKDIEPLIRKLKLISPARIMRNSDAFLMSGVSRSKAVAEAVLHHFNKGKRSKIKSKL